MPKCRVSHFWVISVFPLLIGLSIPAPVRAREAAAPAGASRNISAGLQVTTAAEGSLVFNFVPPPYQVISTQSAGKPCHKIQIDGYANAGAPGGPDLPVTGAMAGIPLSATPSLRILSQEIADIPGQFQLCPLVSPAIPEEISGLPGNLLDIRPAGLQANLEDSYTPLVPVELVSTGMIRSQRVAQLRFSPIQYNPVRGKLRVVRQIRIELQLGISAAGNLAGEPPDEGPFENPLRQTLVNYDQARRWRIARTPALTPITRLGTQPQGQPRLKIEVDRDGLYQVTYSALQSAGLAVEGLDPRTFRLVNQDVEVPISVTGEQDSRFDAGDALFFYGQKTRTRYTSTNVYWLSWGAGDGLRMPVVDGSPVGGALTPASFKTTLHLEEDHRYYNAVPSGPDNDHWYWSLVDASSGLASQSFTFQAPDVAASASPAAIRGLLKGYFASPRHHTRIYLNGHLVDDQTWAATTDYPFTIEVPPDTLLAGTNTLTVECPRDGGITADMVLVNWFEVSYDRQFVAEGSQLAFGAVQPGGWNFQVSGFESSAIQVFDISNPQAPARNLGGSVQPDGTLYRIDFHEQVGANSRYLALDPSRWLSPLGIAPDIPSDLKNAANRADYLIISPRDFLEAIQPLAALRSGQGYRVRVVDAQDIYDEFNGGVFDPQAIRSFLAYAYAYWEAPAPSFVLLAGDGHYDYKDNYGGSGRSYIPPFLGEFDPWIGETAADNRYVTVSGADNLPDLYIGRLPVNSPAETTAVVDKILTYEQAGAGGDWTTRLTFIADNPDSGGDFPGLSDSIAAHFLPPGYTAEKIYYPATHPAVAEAQAAITAAIDQGRLIVNYTGHASVQYWAGEQLLGVNDVAGLSNAGKYPFFIPMTCAEGYYIYPRAPGMDYPSFAESIVRADGKGAIASFSPSGFGLASGHDLLSQGLYHAIFADNILQLGAAATTAKYFLYANSGSFHDLLDTYTLFGDPATRLQKSVNVFFPSITK